MARKFYNQKTFEILPGVFVACETQNTSYGFRHLARLSRNGEIIARSKACYYNRTWERYEYQSVIQSVIQAAGLPQAQEVKALKWAEKGDGSEMAALNMIAGIAKLGEVFANTPKEKNDWKARMLKAGLGDQLSMPDNWDSLSEEERQRRLDGAIGAIS